MKKEIFLRNYFYFLWLLVLCSLPTFADVVPSPTPKPKRPSFIQPNENVEEVIDGTIIVTYEPVA